MQSKNLNQPVIQYDHYRLSLLEWWLAVGKGTVTCGVFAYTFYRSMTAFLILLPLACVYPFYEKRIKQKKRIHQLTNQFKEGMVLLASALSAGYSIENALMVSEQELTLLYGEDGMLTKEFRYMIQQIKTNRSVEQVLWEFSQRSGVEDIQNFSEVFGVAKRSGGNLSEIMRQTADTIRDKMQVKEEIITLTTSKQFEQTIMNLIPFFIVFYVDITSPGFFRQMYETVLGRLLMSVCLVIYLVAYVLAQRILAIEV